VHEVTVGEPPPGAAAAVMAAARTVKMVENCILKGGGWVALENEKCCCWLVGVGIVRLEVLLMLDEFGGRWKGRRVSYIDGFRGIEFQLESDSGCKCRMLASSSMLVCGWLVARSSACPLIMVLFIDIKFSFFGFLDAVIVKRMAPTFAGETLPAAVSSAPYSAIHGGSVGPFAIFEY
jgi:hypothetical protein